MEVKELRDTLSYSILKELHLFSRSEFHFYIAGCSSSDYSSLDEAHFIIVNKYFGFNIEKFEALIRELKTLGFTYEGGACVLLVEFSAESGKFTNNINTISIEEGTKKSTLQHILHTVSLHGRGRLEDLNEKLRDLQ
ncbi:hypothetical protein GCM10008955_26430 [Deinococcus malanensis]|uniref:Uncharacterized protein n=1 Tax=Deinococcus malanensis TaxID=1706855 RepID=A0ABQ2F1H8_9DEIO|nr:hypothetical protein GCM10008955_26430 [Deinococcus malanensis]